MEEKMTRADEYGYNQYELWRALRVIQNDYSDMADAETLALIEQLLNKLA